MVRRELLATLLLLLLSARAATASVGAGVMVGTIAVTDPVHPGGVYHLPPTMIINSGDVPTDYVMRVRSVKSDTTKSPDPSWFRFDPARSRLTPMQTRRVAIMMTVPIDAEPGPYEVLVSNEVDLPKTGKAHGARVVAAAATTVKFAVAPTDWLSALYFRIRGLLSQWMPWSCIVPMALFLAMLLALALRRYRFSFALARRGDHRDEAADEPSGAKSDGAV